MNKDDKLLSRTDKLKTEKLCRVHAKLNLICNQEDMKKDK